MQILALLKTLLEKSIYCSSYFYLSIFHRRSDNKNQDATWKLSGWRYSHQRILAKMKMHIPDFPFTPRLASFHILAYVLFESFRRNFFNEIWGWTSGGKTWIMWCEDAETSNLSSTLILSIALGVAFEILAIILIVRVVSLVGNLCYPSYRNTIHCSPPKLSHTSCCRMTVCKEAWHLPHHNFNK